MNIETINKIRKLFILFENNIIEFEEEIKVLERKIKKYISLLNNSNTFN